MLIGQKIKITKLIGYAWGSQIIIKNPHEITVEVDGYPETMWMGEVTKINPHTQRIEVTSCESTRRKPVHRKEAHG